MKTIKYFLINILFFGLFLTLSTHLYAQDPLVTASNVYKRVLLDNERVRIMEVVFAPGDVADWHSHPDHSVYALTDGQIQITDKGKSSMTMDVKAGEAMYLPAVTHMAKNTGTTILKLIVTEIKEKPAKKHK